MSRKNPRRRPYTRPEARPNARPLTTTPPRSADLASEYTYVLSDLRRLGLLAAVMFSVLVGLALLAQYVL
ncbi:MAG: hypothetical protein ACUVX9_11240 [Anaerolineae bacterium]